MEIYVPTIRTRWDKQKILKDKLTNHLVGLFGGETFNRAEVLKKVGQHIKIVRDQCRVHLETNPRYERPLTIPARECKSLVEYGNERDLKKEES